MDIWVDSIDLTDIVYDFTRDFPTDERFALSSQMQRAVVAVPSNIAEGSGKDSDKDFARFLAISLGSLYELETQLIISQRRGYINTETYYLTLTKIQSLQKRIYAFRQRILVSCEEVL